MPDRPRVYLAGPLSQGDAYTNVFEALRWGNELVQAGFAPFVPHLSFWFDAAYHQEYETWMEIDMAFLETCVAVVRMPGHSPGGDREVARAKGLGIPVYHSVAELVDAVKQEVTQ